MAPGTTQYGMSHTDERERGPLIMAPGTTQYGMSHTDERERGPLIMAPDTINPPLSEDRGSGTPSRSSRVNQLPVRRAPVQTTPDAPPSSACRACSGSTTRTRHGSPAPLYRLHMADRSCLLIGVCSVSMKMKSTICDSSCVPHASQNGEGDWMRVPIAFNVLYNSIVREEFHYITQNTVRCQSSA